MEKTGNHIIFWVVYFLFWWVNRIVQMPEQTAEYLFWRTFSNIIFVCIFFYTVVFILNPAYTKGKNYHFYLLLTLSIIISYSYFYYSTIILSIFVKSGITEVTFKNISARYLTFLMFSLYCSLPYIFINNYIQQEKKKMTIATEKEILEKSILQAELAGLKSQINPHFLYNTLNFLYAQALPLSKKISESIILLSNMMRYSIDENDDEGKVSLKKEVEQVHNLIALFRCQFKSKLNINFLIKGNINYRRIEPLIIVSIVEKSLSLARLDILERPFEIILETEGEIVRLQLNFQNIDDNKDLKVEFNYLHQQFQLLYQHKHSLLIETEKAFSKIQITLLL